MSLSSQQSTSTSPKTPQTTHDDANFYQAILSDPDVSHDSKRVLRVTAAKRGINLD